jgi:hypothetical protein
MDYQNRAGSKPGSGGVAGWSESNVDRRERLRKLALETIDLAKDPYILKVCYWKSSVTELSLVVTYRLTCKISFFHQ